MAAPHWAQNQIWYACYPLGFCDAPIYYEPQISHRLTKLIDWLPKIAELGATGLLLGPIFAASSHGYDTIDHFRIDPRLGDESDFDALIAAAHGLGMKVLLDGVFNHIGVEHPIFQQALADPTDAHNAWFDIDRGPGHPPYWMSFEGSLDLVQLRHAEPAVRDYLVEVMRYWLAKGANGWRLDAAYTVPADCWAELFARVRPEFGEALFLGEVIHHDGLDLAAAGYDSITGYELWKAIWSALKDENFFELDWTFTRYNELCEQLLPLAFISNHDVTRIISQVGYDKALLAAVILLTAPGTPAIYYGDEGGTPGIKYERPGGDLEIRQPLAADLAHWRPPHPEFFNHYQQLCALRKANPWLATARYQKIKLANAQISYQITDGTNQLIVDLQLGEEIGWRVRAAGCELAGGKPIKPSQEDN